MAEERFLGEILVRRGVVPAERLEALYAVQREKQLDLVDLLVNSNVTDEVSSSGMNRTSAVAFSVCARGSTCASIR